MSNDFGSSTVTITIIPSSYIVCVIYLLPI
ncbi:hypothetical protein BCVP_CDS0214 [Bacillus phage BC-VP]|nr:hypothetical protein BCVP_CDS0214 [Bacillus phage BC-VP]